MCAWLTRRDRREVKSVSDDDDRDDDRDDDQDDDKKPRLSVRGGLELREGDVRDEPGGVGRGRISGSSLGTPRWDQRKGATVAFQPTRVGGGVGAQAASGRGWHAVGLLLSLFPSKMQGDRRGLDSECVCIWECVSGACDAIEFGCMQLLQCRLPVPPSRAGAALAFLLTKRKRMRPQSPIKQQDRPGGASRHRQPPLPSRLLPACGSIRLARRLPDATGRWTRGQRSNSPTSQRRERKWSGHPAKRDREVFVSATDKRDSDREGCPRTEESLE